MKRIIVTGAAGFIGYHLSARLCADGKDVLGLDNLNPYYDVSLKEDRLAGLKDKSNFAFEEVDLADQARIEEIFKSFQPDAVVNLAAHAGVRYCLEAPQDFINANILGFVNVLEAAQKNNVQHVVYASSSSVYGANAKVPYAETDSIDHPVSLYAATKASNELIAHNYAHIYGLPCTGLRFFTVYGPWGRPDMAYYKFTKAIFEGHPIDVYNHGEMQRDFTYIDDIIEGVVRLIDKPAQANPDWDPQKPDPSSSYAPYRIYNIGNHECTELMDMIKILESIIGIPAKMNMMGMQPGDVLKTFADVKALGEAVGFRPETPLVKGLENFVRWYREYYDLGNGPILKEA